MFCIFSVRYEMGCLLFHLLFTFSPQSLHILSTFSLSVTALFSPLTAVFLHRPMGAVYPAHWRMWFLAWNSVDLLRSVAAVLAPILSNFSPYFLHILSAFSPHSLHLFSIISPPPLYHFSTFSPSFLHVLSTLSPHSAAENESWPYFAIILFQIVNCG